MQSYTLEEPSLALLNSTLNDGSQHSSPNIINPAATLYSGNHDGVVKHVTPKLYKSKIPTPDSGQRGKPQKTQSDHASHKHTMSEKRVTSDKCTTSDKGTTSDKDTGNVEPVIVHTDTLSSNASRSHTNNLRHRQLFKVYDAWPTRPVSPSGSRLTPTPPERPKSEMGTAYSQNKPDQASSKLSGKRDL